MFTELPKNYEDRTDQLNKYQDYSTRPRVLSAEDAINTGIITRLKSGTIVYKPIEHLDQDVLGKEITIGQDHQYDLVVPTLFGLNEVLVPGTPLTEKFRQEWDKFTESSLDIIGSDKYGSYAYYPQNGDLVRYMVPYWHRLALIINNS